jgi:hypothetical protein
VDFQVGMLSAAFYALAVPLPPSPLKNRFCLSLPLLVSHLRRSSWAAAGWSSTMRKSYGKRLSAWRRRSSLLRAKAA